VKIVWILIAGLVATAVALQWWRHSDLRALDGVWRSLVSQVNTKPPTFDPSLVANLPEPARRFFTATIEPGTPIRTVAEISMHGELSLGSKEDPAYLPMQACQLLAPPFGFYWHVNAGRGFMSFMGSDGSFANNSWTRFWLAGLIPVARMGNNPDHAKSSFGRFMADSIFWVPAALLPSAAVTWSAIDTNTARVTVERNALSQAFDLTVDEAGRPTKIRFERWSDANVSKTYRRQPFGGYFYDFQNFDGYWLPTTIVAGNHFETDEYFPFFKATVDAVRFIDNPDSERQCRPSKL